MPYFGHLMQRANSWGKTLMLGKIEGKRRKEQQRMRWLDSITNFNGHESEQSLEILEDRGARYTTGTVNGASKVQAQT